MVVLERRGKGEDSDKKEHKTGVNIERRTLLVFTSASACCGGGGGGF